MYALLIILLVVLPFGTAIACGALMQWAGNTISGNTGSGIAIQGGTASILTTIQGNRIGTNAAASQPFPNGLSGISVNADDVRIGGTVAGAANIIANNTQAGVTVTAGVGNLIVGNSIFANGMLGINLGPSAVAANDAGDGDTGPNNLQNYPVLAAASEALGRVGPSQTSSRNPASSASSRSGERRHSMIELAWISRALGSSSQSMPESEKG